jgi:hypothetical protein
MWKFAVSFVVVAVVLFVAGSAFADGHGPYHGGYPHHGGYYHGGYAYHHVYAPPVHRPRVVYPAPYVVAQPIFPPPVYAPAYPGCGYHTAPGGSLYIQGRNFGFGIGF